MREVNIKKRFTTDDILDGGRRVFEMEGVRIQRKHITSPFNPSEKTPSFLIKLRNGKYVYTCYSTNRSGDCIGFIMELYGLTFKQALERIEKQYVNTSERIIIPKSPNIEIPLEIDWSSKPFTKKHHEYFNAGGLSEDFLKTLNMFALKDFAYNKVAQKMTTDEFSFAYWAEDINRVKILRLGPNIAPQDKWRTDIPKEYVWRLGKYTKENNLFVSKSNKDMAVLLYLEREATCTQSENSQVLIENMPKILEVCDSPIINYGSNPVDKQKSIDVNIAYPQCRYFNTPNHLLKFDIEDNFDYCKSYGITAFDKLLKRKGL